MKGHTITDQSRMVSRLFFKLLPVQVAIVAMGSINSIVDGIVAARFIDSAAVGVIGLYHTMVLILEASGAVLLGGVSVLSGRYLGAGKLDKTRGVCSLGFTAALILGLLISLASLIAPGAIARFLGADIALKEPLSVYVRGYAIGIVPQLLVQQLAANLQLERQDRRGQIGVITMIGVNVALDFLFVAKLRMGVWGLALSTSLSNWAYFLVLGQFYLTGKAKLMPDPRLAAWNELPEMLKTGSANALTVICLAGRSLAANRILLYFSGADGLSAFSAFGMINGLLIAIALGTGAVVRMLASVFVGEENREGLAGLLRTIFTHVMAMILIISVAVFVLSPVLSRVFFPDTASNVYELTRQLFVIYSFCIPLVLACITIVNYCQAIGHQQFVVITAVLDGFISFVVPASLLAPSLGALSVWLAYPIGLVITLAYCALRAIRYLGHFPRNLDECLMLPEDFGKGDRLVLILHGMEDVTQTAVQVQAFCAGHGLPVKTASHAGLCLEEIAGNVVRHGFTADKRQHMVEVRVAPTQAGALLRIKDDCIPFNPQEWHDMAAAGTSDPCANVGIRLVYGIAKEIQYQNLLGLNVLSITIA